MPEILSQKDLDALILSLTTDDKKQSETRAGPFQKHLVRVYDFNRPDKFSRDQIRTVEMLHDNIARLSSTFLAAQVRTMVSVVVASVDQMAFEEFIGMLPSPSYVAAISLQPLKGSMFLTVDIPIAIAMVDRLFGGPGGGQVALRPLTEIEMTIIDRLVRGLLPTIRESWSTITNMEPKLESTTSNPSFIQNLPSNEMSVVVRFEMKVGKATGAMTLCLPFVSIEPVLPRLSAQNWFTVLRREMSKTEDAAIAGRLAQMEIDLVANLGKASLTVREVLGLEPGDVIQLETRVKDPMRITMEGRPKFFATPGRTGPQLCFKVTKVIKEEDNDG